MCLFGKTSSFGAKGQGTILQPDFAKLNLGSSEQPVEKSKNQLNPKYNGLDASNEQLKNDVDGPIEGLLLSPESQHSKKLGPPEVKSTLFPQTGANMLSQTS